MNDSGARAPPAKHAGVHLWMRLIPPELRGSARTILLTLLAGYVIRVLLLPLFAGPDAVTTAWISSNLLSRGQLILSNDPPPIFYLQAGMIGLFRPLISPDMWQLLTSGVGFTPATLLQARALNTPGIGILISVIKLPYLFFDLATSILLLWTFRDSKIAIAAFQIWTFNPIVLFVTQFAGQYDIIPVFFVLLAYYYCRTNRRIPSVVALAIAVAFKFFAIALAPLLLLYYLDQDRGLRQKAKTTVVTAVIVLSVLAVLIAIPAMQGVYYESANMALPGDQVNGFFVTTYYNRGVSSASALGNGIITFLTYSMGIPAVGPGNDIIVLAPMIYGVVILVLAYLRRKTYTQIWGTTATLFLAFYAFSLFYPQWFLWGQPFLIALVAQDRRRLLPPYAVLIASFFIYTWRFADVLTTAPLVPLIPDAARWQSPLVMLTVAGLPAFFVTDVAHSVLSAVCVFFGYVALRDAFFPRGLRAL